MIYEVVWSDEAKLTVRQNMDYLSLKWDNKVLNDFLNQVESGLEKIKRNPLSYPSYRSNSKIWAFRINKRIVLYYRVGNSTIELVTFWNTYRNPEDLKL